MLASIITMISNSNLNSLSLKKRILRQQILTKIMRADSPLSSDYLRSLLRPCTSNIRRRMKSSLN